MMKETFELAAGDSHPNQSNFLPPKSALVDQIAVNLLFAEAVYPRLTLMPTVGARPSAERPQWVGPLPLCLSISKHHRSVSDPTTVPRDNTPGTPRPWPRGLNWGSARARGTGQRPGQMRFTISDLPLGRVPRRASECCPSLRPTGQPAGEAVDGRTDGPPPTSIAALATTQD